MALAPSRKWKQAPRKWKQVLEMREQGDEAQPLPLHGAGYEPPKSAPAFEPARHLECSSRRGARVHETPRSALVRLQQRRALCSRRSSQSSGWLGFSASAARRESEPRPALSPGKTEAATPLLASREIQPRRFSRKVQRFPMRPSQEACHAGESSLFDAPYPGQGAVRVVGVPSPLSVKAESKQTRRPESQNK